MKSKISLILMITLLFSCNIDYLKQSNVEFESLNEIQAKELAQNEVANIASSQTAKVWNSNSKVVSAFPVYLDGIDGISYYECKVTTNGQDSGYVLVNINNTDFPIVEACETGVTLNESYANSTGLEVGSFDVYRYGYLESVAYANEEGATLSSTNDKKERKVVGATGIDVDNFDFDAFKKAVKKNNGSPYSTVSNEKEGKLASRATTGKDTVDAKYVVEDPKKFKFNGSRSPEWNQFIINGKTFEPQFNTTAAYPNRHIGCGPIAWAITLAFWQEQHGKSNLFSAPVSSATVNYNQTNFMVNPNVYYDIIKMDNVLETSRAAGAGYTAVHKMHFIEKYINSKGYSCSIAHDNGGYDAKFNRIYDEILQQRPVVMGIHAYGIGAIDHYVVIEGAKRHSESKKSYIWYYCNTGHAEHLYIYAFHERAVNPGSITGSGVRCSTYSFWTLNIY